MKKALLTMLDTPVAKRRPLALAVVAMFLAVTLPMLLPAGSEGAPLISATDRDSLVIDQNSDGSVNRGDTIRHTITITNTGSTDADAVNLLNTLDADITLVAGSVKTTPLAINDTYTTHVNNQLTILAAAGVLANDRDPDGGSLTAIKVTNPASGTLTLSANGSFIYTPANDFIGTDSFTYKNNDGTADSNIATVQISVTDQAPVSTDKAYPASGNIRIAVSAPGLKTGATDADADDIFTTLTVKPFTGPSAQGGDVVISADGSFNYDPPAGYTGSDTFTYQVCDPHAVCGTASTVTVTVSSMTWFVNNNAGACSSNCDGRLSHPFTTLAAFQAVNNGTGRHPAQNQNIFVYESSTAYSGPVTLLNSQKLIGQDAASGLAVLTGITLPANSDPFPAMNSGNAIHSTIGNPSGNAVVLGSANAVYGLTLGNSSGVALSGNSFGTLTTEDVLINSTGQALSLTTGTLSGSFISITSSGGARNIMLSGVNGALNVGGALSGATGNAFEITGGSAAVTYSGTISNATALTVYISAKTSGTVTFSNVISGRGISLINNAGAIISFTSGSMNLITGTNDAFTATGGGTVTVIGTNNSISTTTGTALNIVNTTIGAAGLNFQSIAVNGAATGIILNNTGTTGIFTVTGTGTTAGSGGTLQNTTQAGARITGPAQVILNNMNINSSVDKGLSVSGATQVTLTNTAFSQNTNAALYMSNTSGTLTVTGSSFTNTVNDAVVIDNTSSGLAALIVSLTGCSINGTTTGRGVLLQTAYAQTITTTITGAAFSHSSPAAATCRFTGLNGAGVIISEAGPAQANPSLPNVTVSNCSFSTINSGDSIKINPGGGVSRILIQNNLIDGMGSSGSRSGDGIDVEADNNAVVDASVLNNTVKNLTPLARGRGVRIKRDETALTRVAVDSNAISNTYGEGILVEARKNVTPGVSASDANVIVTGNTLSATNQKGSTLLTGGGIHIRAWEGEADTSPKARLCTAVSGNTVTSSGYRDFLLVQRNGATFRLEGYAGSVTDTNAINTYVGSTNNANLNVASSVNSNGITGVVSNTCARPVQ